MSNPLLKGFSIVMPRQELEDRLASNQLLTIKLGIDPTASEIHLGFWALLKKFARFIDAGHKGVLIFGDFTASIGDPTGRSTTRPVLTHAQIRSNSISLLQQIERIIPSWKFMVRYNSTWWMGSENTEPFSAERLLAIAQKVTVNQLMHREDFAKRLEANEPIGLHEFIYPLIQGWDSVLIDANVELGGQDQLFNCMMGRDLQRDPAKQCVCLMPLLRGIDGVQKMSKSLGNSIGVSDEPLAMFSKIMSIPDDLTDEWLEILLDLNPEHVRDQHPVNTEMMIKLFLAREVVSEIHGQQAAEDTMNEWSRIHRMRELPENIGDIELELDENVILSKLVLMAGLASSHSEAKRSVQFGAVSVNEQQCKFPETLIRAEWEFPLILRCGRKYVRIMGRYV